MHTLLHTVRTNVLCAAQGTFKMQDFGFRKTVHLHNLLGLKKYRVNQDETAVLNFENSEVTENSVNLKTVRAQMFWPFCVYRLSMRSHHDAENLYFCKCW